MGGEPLDGGRHRFGGAKPLLRNGRRTRNIGVLLADSTDLLAMPMATVSHARANAIMASTANARSQ